MRVALLASALLMAAACQGPAPDSLLIHNAIIMDGSGDPAYLGSVRIDGDRIVSVGELHPLRNEETLDAGGLVLAPGFIDTHSHHDRRMSEHRDMLGVVSQGVTTIVRGADGDSGLAEAYGYQPLEDFNARFAEAPVAVNVASFAPHGSIRAAVMGADFRRHASDEEIAGMSALVEADMQQGALGLATGLEYMPGIYASTEEVIALSRVASAHGGHYMSHVRDEDDRFIEAVDEILRIGREAQIPVQISHIKLGDKKFWGTTDTVLAKLKQARADGILVSADIYPYLYWQSNLAVLFPARDYTDRNVATFTFERTTTPETLIIARFEPNPRYNGMSVAAIAKLNEQDVETTLLELTQASDGYLQETGYGGDSIIAKGMDEQDLYEFMAWEHTNICSDGGFDGSHPRGYGAFPRFFSHYANEKTGITREMAVARMTRVAARNVGIGERGQLMAGYYADLVLFDPATFTDHATFEEPNELSTGVVSVWVNGEVVFRNGESTGVYAGRTLSRPGDASL